MRKIINPIQILDDSIICDKNGEPIRDGIGLIQRNHKIINTFEVCNVATEFKTPANLLKLFYKNNPMGFSIGCLHQKRQFYEGDIMAFGYCGGFGVFLYEEPMESHHQVVIKFASPFDDKWYNIATGKHEVILEMFAKQPSKAKKSIEQMVRLRQFSLPVNHDEIYVPWS